MKEHSMRSEQLPVSNREEVLESAVEAVSEGESAEEGQGPFEQRELSPGERLEAREFSKENSRAARSRLAKQIMQNRWWYRVKIPKITAEQDAAVFVEQEIAAGQQAERLQALGDLEKSLAALKTEREQWAALEAELNQVGEQLERVKAGFWAYFLNRFTKKIDKLEAKRLELYQQEEVTPRVSEWAVPNAERDLEQKRTAHQQSTQHEEGRVQRMLDKNRIILQRLIEDDDWVETSKQQIKRFYEKNLDLKRDREANPEERDLALNCRKHNIVLMHGFPIERPSAQTDSNQPSFETYDFLGEERALVMAALEPAVATASKSLDTYESAQFPRKEMYYNTGFILAGGEITSAYERDAGTYAHDLDSRFPKYDAGAVSDYQEDISEKVRGAVDSDDRRSRQETSHNEISVKHPKIAALYMHDEYDVFGKPLDESMPFFDDSLVGELGKAKLKTMLQLAEKMGLPVILTKKSGEMISLTDGKRPITLDELLDNPVAYSPEERLTFLEEANVGEKMKESTGPKTQQQIEKKMAGFSETFAGADPAMEERKQRNKDLAAVQLKLLSL